MPLITLPLVITIPNALLCTLLGTQSMPPFSQLIHLTVLKYFKDYLIIIKIPMGICTMLIDIRMKFETKIIIMYGRQQKQFRKLQSIYTLFFHYKQF